MPKIGYKLTEIERQNLSITEKQFSNIIEYGARTLLEKTFCSFMIDSMGRRQVAENVSFEDIDWENNRFIKFEKYNTGIKRHRNELDIDYENRRAAKIKEDIRKGKIKEIKFRGSKAYKRIKNGYFSVKTKNLLLELQMYYKTGKIFRRTKDASKALSPTALTQMWERCVIKTNKRIDELGLHPSNKIIHPDPNKAISLHDIRRARPRNYHPKDIADVQTMQEMLGHENFQTTFNIYAKQSPQETQKRIREGLFKDNNTF